MIVQVRIAALAACLVAAPGAALAGGFYSDGCHRCVHGEWPVAAWRGGGANVRYSGGVVFARDYWPARRHHVHRHYYGQRIVTKSALPPPRVIYGPR